MVKFVKHDAGGHQVDSLMGFQAFLKDQHVHSDVVSSYCPFAEDRRWFPIGRFLPYKNIAKFSVNLAF